MKRFLQFLFSNNPKDAEPDEKTPSGASEKPKSSRSLLTVEFDHKRADNPEVREYLRLCAKEIPCKEIKNVDAVEQLLVRFAEKGAGDLHFFVNELSQPFAAFREKRLCPLLIICAVESRVRCPRSANCLWVWNTEHGGLLTVVQSRALITRPRKRYSE